MCDFDTQSRNSKKDRTLGWLGTAASECSFTPARCCNTVFASELTGVSILASYDRQRVSASSIALVVPVDSFGIPSALAHSVADYNVLCCITLFITSLR